MLAAMLLVLLAACGQIALLNSPPSVQIESPEPGALVSHTEPLVFLATVDDDYTPLDELTFLWALSDGSPIGGDLLLDATERTVTFTTTGQLPKGEPTVTLRVIDALGESSRASVKLLVFDDLPPTITWNTPVDGGRYPAGAPLEVSVTVNDPDPLEDTSLQLLWSGSAITGETALKGSLAQSGDLTFTLDSLAITSWTLGLSVTDALGAAVESTVTFTMADADRDHDGYLDLSVAGGTDCDDSKSAVHPGADEHCNTADDDCDGLVDEDAVDAPPWYLDYDADGFGDPDNAYTNCTSVANRVANAEDCDDSDFAVNPDAVEVCDEVDNDCDADTDTLAVDRLTVWFDNDQDGYGVGAAYTVCVAGDEDAPNGDDCDDGASRIHPGAAEVCDAANDDEDCNGDADDDDAGATGQTTFYADLDADRHGDPSVTMLRCDGGTDWTTTADDCDDAEPAAWTGNVETCEDGADNDCSGGDGTCKLSGDIDLSDADYALTGVSLTFAGAEVVGLGDIDGDGLDDVAVSAWAGESVYVVSGADLASGALSSFGRFTGSASGDYFGWSMAAVGDLDADGSLDLAVGAVDENGGDGAVYLFTASGAGGTPSDATWMIAGGSGESLGSAVAGGADVGGDGTPDVLVGGAGIVYVYDGSSGSYSATWTGGGTGLGSALATAPDVDGDGEDDMLVGDHSSDRAYVVYAGYPGDLDLSAADAVLDAAAPGDDAGYALCGVGDVDGDGHGDILVGAPSADGSGDASGVAYLLTWDTSTGIPSGSLSTAYATFSGEDAYDRAGYTVAGPGDVDGDGLADLLVGAYYDESGGAGAGAAYLMYADTVSSGSSSLAAAGARFLGESTGDAASEGLAGVGDVNGDGYADLGIGAPGTGAAAGTAYIVLGGGL